MRNFPRMIQLLLSPDFSGIYIVAQGEDIFGKVRFTSHLVLFGGDLTDCGKRLEF